MLALHRRVERGRDKRDGINGQFIVIVIVVYSTSGTSYIAGIYRRGLFSMLVVFYVSNMCS